MLLLPNNETSEYLKSLSATAEEIGELIPEQLNIIYRENWFRLFVPKAFGGLEADFIDALQLEESLAKIDGSLGWTVTLCSGACMFMGYMDIAISKEIFSNPKVCFAGSGHAAGIAKKTSNGFTVQGRWQYATGASHATIFTANCLIEYGGNIIRDDNDTPVVKTFFFKKDEVTISEDWDAMGLKATASNSFSVNDVFVNYNRSFNIDTRQTTLNNAIYSYPFVQFAEATLAVNYLGMAFHFLDECTYIFETIKVSNAQKNFILLKLEDSLHNIVSLKKDFYDTVTTNWHQHLANKKSSGKNLASISDISRKMVYQIKSMVTELYPFCGLSHTNSHSTINRIWRDIFTASQHRLLNVPNI